MTQKQVLKGFEKVFKKFIRPMSRVWGRLSGSPVDIWHHATAPRGLTFV